MRLFKLKFHSALHVDSKGSGEPESIEEFIHSDTLSAALCLAWKALFPKTKPEFFLEPPFVVSSAFPYMGGTLFFPKPQWNIWKDMDVSYRKQEKKVHWLSKSLLYDILEGKRLNFKAIHVLDCGLGVSKDELSQDAELLKTRAWVLSERQRVGVDRLGMQGESALFFFALQFFSRSSGLYFIVDVPEGEYEKFRAVLNYLGDTGLGADRNSGLGHFKIETEEGFMIEVRHKKGRLNLSLFNPGPDDDIVAITKKSAYEVVTRAGWISNSRIGRPPVRVFAEGSYFSGKPKGRVVHLLNEETRRKFSLNINHSAPRDFRAFCLPCAEPSGLEEGGDING